MGAKMNNDISRQDSKFLMMTTAPVEKLVCKLAVPTIISMMITAIYNIADTYFVSRLGTSAAGAVGVVFSMMAIIQACGFFFGNGSGNFISRKLGEKKSEEAEEMASTAFYSALIVGALIGVLGLIFINPLGKGLGATETILPYAMEYLKYIMMGTPFMMASFVLNNQLRFQGCAAYGMIGICIGAFLNIVLDPILIFACNLGIAGAAIATSISQFVGLCVLFYLCNKKGIIKIKLKNFRPGRYYFSQIFKGGLPSLFRQGIASIATICLNQFAGVYGDAAIAAMSIVSRVGMFAGSALIGFGQGFQPVCGFNYGAREFTRVRKAFSFCIKVSTVVLALFAITGFCFAEQIMGIFKTGDSVVVGIGMSALRWQCISFPLLGFITLSNMMLQTIGKSAKASILALARQGLFYIPILAVFAPAMQLLGIKMAQPAADILAFIISIPFVFSVIKEMKQETYMDNHTADSSARTVPRS